jgi:hypothetical protein
MGKGKGKRRRKGKRKATSRALLDALGGKCGGRSRMGGLSPEQRSELPRTAALSRWRGVRWATF